MKLEDIGFYTLSDQRAKNVSLDSPLQRCELILTPRCNFDCDYCRGSDKPELSYQEAKHIVRLWTEDGLKNIRFSGGEPTLWPGLLNLVRYAQSRRVERIAVSTNGSADYSLYRNLVWNGANDFSISLDACCAATGDEIAGSKGSWERVKENIAALSDMTYVTVGIVVTPETLEDLPGTIKLATDLGVSDIRVISAAQWGEDSELIRILEDIEIPSEMPILKYRIENMKYGRYLRGLTAMDNDSCPLVMDDMAVAGDSHYACIIHMREGGEPIGKVGTNMRRDRLNWCINHNTFEDPICQKNCLDVCIDYNNRVREFQKEGEEE